MIWSKAYVIIYHYGEMVRPNIESLVLAACDWTPFVVLVVWLARLALSIYHLSLSIT